MFSLCESCYKCLLAPLDVTFVIEDEKTVFVDARLSFRLRFFSMPTRTRAESRENLIKNLFQFAFSARRWAEVVDGEFMSQSLPA